MDDAQSGLGPGAAGIPDINGAVLLSGCNFVGDILDSANTTGFGYIDEEGMSGPAPGRLRLDSILVDGNISGSFTDVSLPHAEKALPNIVLQDGSFTAKLWPR